jgi:hypothetical protein
MDRGCCRRAAGRKKRGQRQLELGGCFGRRGRSWRIVPRRQDAHLHGEEQVRYQGTRKRLLVWVFTGAPCASNPSLIRAEGRCGAAAKPNLQKRKVYLSHNQMHAHISAEVAAVVLRRSSNKTLLS